MDDILKDIDNSYPIFDKRYRLHYYGDESTIYHIYRINYSSLDLPKLATNIIELCTGENSIRTIYDTVKGYNGFREEDLLSVQKFINKMVASNILFLSSSKRKIKINLSGKRGAKYPYMLLLELTNACNFNCGHCYKNAENKKNNFMDIDDVLNIIENINKYTPIIGLSGGEPTIHPQIEKIIEFINKESKIILYTNGTKVPALSENTVKNISLVAISMYGYDINSYLYATGNKMGFDYFVSCIEFLLSCDVNIVAVITVNKLNMHKLKNYIKFLIYLGVKHVSFGVAFPAGRSITLNQNQWVISNDELAFISDEIAGIKKQYTEIIVQQEINYNDVYFATKDNKVNNNEIFTCMAGKKTIIVTENGFIKPCVMMPDELYSSIKYNEYFDAINDVNKINFIKKIDDVDRYLKQYGFCVEDMKCKGFYESLS